MQPNISTESFDLELDQATADKFAAILNDESLMHAGFVAHQANNVNNGLDLPPST